MGVLGYDLLPGRPSVFVPFLCHLRLCDLLLAASAVWLEGCMPFTSKLGNFDGQRQNPFLLAEGQN